MSERNAIKNRQCKTCGEYVLGKAYKLKVHGIECEKVLKDAAQQALMDRIREELEATSDAEFTLPVYDNSQVKMADEGILNAEGD